MAERPQHPHQAAGSPATGVVVGHDDGVVTDPEPAHRRRKLLGRWQRVASRRGGAGPGQIVVEVDEAGAGDVTGLVRGATGSPVEVPPHVGEDDGAGVTLEPVGVGEDVHQRRT